MNHWIKSMSLNPISLRSVLILPFHWYLTNVIRGRQQHYSEQQTLQLQQPVHLKMAIQAETSSEIGSNKGTMDYITLRRHRNPKLDHQNGLFPSGFPAKFLNIFPISAPSRVSIATGCGLDGRGIRVQVPVRVRFFSVPRRPDQFWSPPSLLASG
jgi:hypothetical protein